MIDGLGDRLELVLVAFLAAQEVELLPPARDRVPNEVRQQDHAGGERGPIRREARVVEADRAVPLDRDERGDRPGRGVEEPEPGGGTLGERAERAPEESL